MLTHFFINSVTGQVVAQAVTGDKVRADWYVKEQESTAEDQGLAPSQIVIKSHSGHTPFTNPVAESVNGEWMVTDDLSSPPVLYVHVTLTGGMQSPAGTLYLKNDGVDALAVHAELRDGPDPAASSAVTQLEGNDIDGTWALELVNVDTGALADTPLVQMTAGVIDVSYTTTIAPCELELAEDRLQPIGDYQLKLAQPVRFKIARALT